ncbi:MAG: glycosyltransferase family 2 protein [Chloroflexota bacterium]
MTFMKISVITPSLNRAHLLEAAIQSVAAQNYPDYEHIVVDGGSTDDTTQIVQKYPGIKFISGSDSGMYDALNKGLEIATGQIIGFLNTDDHYASDIFSKVAQKFEDREIMAVAGRAVVFSKALDGKITIVNKYFPEDKSLIECSTIGSNFFNAWFFRRSTFDQIGNFNANYRIVGDRDFMLRFALNHLKYIIIDNLVYKYHQHPGSLTFDKSGQKREWCAIEHLTMTSIYLASQGLSEEERNLLVQLRTLETMDLAARSLWARNYRKFTYCFAEGLKCNRAWPLSFFRYVIERGATLFLTKLSVKSLSWFA